MKKDEIVKASRVPVTVFLADFALGSPVRGDMDEFLPSLTRQEFADECDINALMDRYEKHGVISHVNRAQPVYMDLAGVPDLREALDYMRDAQVMFNSLPATTRFTFDNDAVKFVEYAQNPANIEKMREWGLAAPKAAAPEPMLVKVVPEVPSPPPQKKE